MKLKLVLVTVILVSLLSLALPMSHAQFAWEVVLYDLANNQVVTLNPLGVSQQIALTITPPQYSYGTTALSPNRRYLAINSGDSPNLLIVDLQTMSAVNVPNPIPNATLDAYILGFFSPDSQQFVTGYAGAQGEGQNFQQLGGLIVVNAATGAIQTTLSANQYQQAAALFPDGWTSDGIYFHPSCWACEPAISGVYQRWNPTNGTTQTTDIYFDLVFGDRLSSSGEFLYTTDRIEFPADPNGVGFFLPANVVEYYAEGTTDDMEDKGQVVFFDPNNLNLSTARWVVNGNALMVVNYANSQATVAFRDGSQTSIVLQTPADKVVGTPDGWLTIDNEQSRVYHYYVDTATKQITVNLLADFDGEVSVLQTPDLSGSTAAFTQNIQAPQQSACPGFQPSRLRVARMAQVTPGDPNNMRDGAGLNFARIGQIPGGEQVYVLEGPICADNMAWWQVNYQGTVGWTSEGTGNSYWMEPSEGG